MAIHNIKQREGGRTRAFITRYTDDTLQILGLHEEQRISGFVHGLRTRSLVEHLSTDLPSTYKGLMEKTYTWVEAREVATNGVLNNRRDDPERSKKFSWGNNIGPKDGGRFSPYKGQNHKLLSNLVKSPREILTTEKVAKTFEQPPQFPGANWSRTKYCHFHEDYRHETNQCRELRHQIEEAVKSGQLAYLVKGVKKEKATDPSEWTQTLLSSASQENSRGHWDKYPWISRLGRAPSQTAMQQMGIVVSTVHGAIKFHTPRGIGTIFSEYNSQKPKEEEGGSTNRYQGKEEIILSCTDTEERVVINDKYPEQMITIGRQLPTRIKIRLRDLLKKYVDVFAWTSAHITGVPRILMIRGETFNTEHWINVFNHAEPIKQKKRSLAPERNEVIHNQVEELTKARILQEVKYQTWVSNPMVVKKDNGKWKLRVDFTNINKTCIREPHPLPADDQKAESLHEYRLKCFLDAYKGYHQIHIAEKDEEKTAFFTREGVFCYKRLPFGLKNARATYQRLIDKGFGHQMGRNMEVNADDMVIMSDSEEEMMADITETLERLWAINLKLNPKKCSFGVEEGVYSGHLTTKQGIRADPYKVPLKERRKDTPFHEKSEKLYECKNGSMEEKSRRSLPKNERMPKVITNDGHTNKGRNSNNVPRNLRRNRERKLEKLILALVYAARRLRRYFQAHPIQVLGEKPIKQILAKPEKSSRIAKWAIELGEREIEFRGRNSIKGQILADFMAETPPSENKEAKNKEVKRKELEPKNAWKLFTNGASSSDGSGAGLMVVSPEGKEYTYVLRFTFETTNNEAEYEALLAGLRIAKEMEIQELIISVDSQLVANQVKGLFEARQTTIKQLLEKPMDLLSSFHSYSIEHIKREQNKKADALNKLASMTFSKLAKEVIVEVI
ncbi:reverse transcriptase domain-containing protein [Tanacetum coccineum]